MPVPVQNFGMGGLVQGAVARADERSIRREAKGRDRPLLVDPEGAYLPGRNAPQPEWDHYWEVMNAITGARINPDIVAQLLMPDSYTRPPPRRRGLQILPPVTMPEGVPEQQEAPPPNARGLINRQRRNPWD